MITFAPVKMMPMLYLLLTSLPLMTCAFFTVYIALELRNKELRELPALFYYMLTATVLYTGHFAYFNHTISLIPFTDMLYLTANLAVYPLYLIYIIRLTRSILPSHYLLLLPAAIGAIACGLTYSLMSPEETNQFIQTYLYHNHTEGLAGQALTQAWIHTICKVVFALEIIITVIVGIRLIRNYNHIVEEFYADTDDKSLHTIRTILILVLIASVMSLACNIIGRYQFIDSMWMLAIPSLSFTILLFCIAFVGLHRRFSFCDMLDEQAVIDDKMLDDKKMLPQESLTERINLLMKEEQLFLQPNLKLENLAQLLQTNRTYVYQAINQQMGMTFSELINRQRIAYAKELIEKHPEMSMSDVANKSGFASLSSFYRNLKIYKQSVKMTD
jgi:AraC-like DNA-binding protein